MTQYASNWVNVLRNDEESDRVIPWTALAGSQSKIIFYTLEPISSKYGKFSRLGVNPQESRCMDLAIKNKSETSFTTSKQRKLCRCVLWNTNLAQPLELESLLQKQTALADTGCRYTHKNS